MWLETCRTFPRTLQTYLNQTDYGQRVQEQARRILLDIAHQKHLAAVLQVDLNRVRLPISKRPWKEIVQNIEQNVEFVLGHIPFPSAYAFYHLLPNMQRLFMSDDTAPDRQKEWRAAFNCWLGVNRDEPSGVYWIEEDPFQPEIHPRKARHYLQQLLESVERYLRRDAMDVDAGVYGIYQVWRNT